MNQVIEKRIIHCVGCGRTIAWDGKGTFAYTCICGAIVFCDSVGKLYPPASLILVMAGQKECPHIDYYLGVSNYVSIEKQQVYEALKKLGAIWTWECDKCKQRFLERKKMEVKEGLLRIELHPELQAAIEG